jgi:hypothetical protein
MRDSRGVSRYEYTARDVRSLRHRIFCVDEGGMEMKVVICTVAYGGWYRKGLERQIREFERVSPGYEMQGWLNVLPPGTPHLVKDGYDYTGYAAKPWAMRHAMNSGADVALLIDASVYPIKHIEPLIDFIWDHGYYLAPAGFTIGEWTNDEMLGYYGFDRDHALKIPDVASGIVGFRLKADANTQFLVDQWCCATTSPGFAAPHSNVHAADKRHHYRNVGHVSYDPRCSGHRQDQSALSLIAHQLGLTDLTPWPRFVAYQAGHGGKADDSTVLQIAGM